MELLDPSTTHAFRTALEKALRPRDETLDHHQFHEQVLAQTYGDTILRHPLALLSPDVGAASRPADEQATPSRLEELIDTNIRLNKELRQLQEASRTGPDSSDVGSAPTTTKPNAGQAAPDVQDGEVIALQLQVNALEEKRSRLGIFLGALDRLETLPAAEPEFLQPSAVFHACSPLPEMPGALMEGFTRDNSAPQHEVETMMRGLHKAVLRNKLLAQREKRKLDAMRKQGVGGGGLADPSALPAEVQLHALTAVKDHLIGWIEAQLMEAGDEEEEEGDDDNDGGRNGGSGLPQRSLGTAAKTSSQKGEIDLDTQLADIQREYSEHINLRKEVAMLLAETEGVNHELEQFRGMRIAEDAAPPQQSSKPPASLPPSSALDPPAMLMLTPYLEKLQASAREQKALVQEKSHINSAVTRQQQHMSQVIHDLVEESQLLRAYPNATALDATNHRGSRRSSSNTRRSFADATRRGGSTTSKTSVSKQVEPFVYAADSAKIATLEAVVDKIELGQMAVDEAMGRLGEVRRFLNKPDDDKDGDDADTRVNRRHSVQMQAAQGHRRRITEGKIIIADQHEKSIWSKLDGNLGLIND